MVYILIAFIFIWVCPVFPPLLDDMIYYWREYKKNRDKRR